MTAVAAITPPPSFQAQWNEQIPQKSILNLKEKVWQVARVILALIVLPLVVALAVTVTIIVKGDALIRVFSKKGVLPSAWQHSEGHKNKVSRAFKTFWTGPVSESNRWMRDRYEMIPHKMLTPDKIELNGYFFKHRESAPETDTVVLCQSNNAFTEEENYSWLIQKAVEKHSVCNFFAFDYRGVSTSKGSANNTRDLLVDCETTFQFLRDHLQVTPAQMRWYGWSLGGALSANMKALHPECTNRYANVRSLASIRDVVTQAVPRFFRFLFFWLPGKMERDGWGLEAPLSKIQGEMMIVYHKDDWIIPYKSSAHAAAAKANLVFHDLQLLQTPEQLAEAQGQDVDHHTDPFTNYVTQNGTPADEAIANFILPPGNPIGVGA